MIPIRTDYRMKHRPWVNYALIAVNVLVYVAGYNGATLGPASPWLLQPDQPTMEQFITSMFLHGGIGHLVGNMLFLWVFGNAINDKLGQAGYLAFYLGGGLLAGVGYLLLSGHAPVLGASGAISAVTGAYLVLLPRARVTVLMIFYFIMPLEISSLYFLLFQFIWNMLATMSEWAGPYASGGVAYAAHSAGYVYGILIAAALLAIRLLPRDPFDLLSLVSSSRRRSRYRQMVSEGYDPFKWSGAAGSDASRWVDAAAVDQATPDSPQARELVLRREISERLGQGDQAGAAQRYLQLVQIADDAVLSRPQQLDVANYLMSSDQHAPAADAYERFLAHYGNYEHLADIHLMLGLLYGRYLRQYDRAEMMLTQAIERLRDPRKVDMARAELAAARSRRRS